MNKDVWIIIPVFNRKQITQSCLEHLQSLGIVSEFQVLIADGGSSDGTQEMVREEFPTVHLIQGEWWWTEAIRAGMKYAMSYDAEIMIWLNDDSQPRSGCVEKLVAHVRKTGHVSGGITYGADGAYTANRRVGRSIRKVTAAECRDKDIMEVDSLSGNFVAVPAKCVEKIGYPDADLFPHSFGDDDYTSVATRAGMGCDLLPSVEADDMQTSRTLVGASILRGSRPIKQHIREQCQWNPRLGWLPALRFHRRFLGIAGMLNVFGLWMKNWFLIAMRLLLPRFVRSRL